MLRWLSDDGPLSFALFVRAAQCAIEAGLLNEVVPENVLGSATQQTSRSPGCGLMAGSSLATIGTTRVFAG